MTLTTDEFYRAFNNCSYPLRDRNIPLEHPDCFDILRTMITKPIDSQSFLRAESMKTTSRRND
jgi:hypothetical protein